MALRTLLTTCLFASCVLVNRAWADDVAEFKLLNFSGSDSYPEYEHVVKEAAGVGTKASLRCVENGYDGSVTWRYHELMVFDASGPAVRRKEPRADVAVEHGYRYQFKNFDECEKAAPQVIDGSAVCTMKLRLNRLKGTASFVSSECKQPSQN